MSYKLLLLGLLSIAPTTFTSQQPTAQQRLHSMTTQPRPHHHANCSNPLLDCWDLCAPECCHSCGETCYSILLTYQTMSDYLARCDTFLKNLAMLCGNQPRQTRHNPQYQRTAPTSKKMK